MSSCGDWSHPERLPVKLGIMVEAQEGLGWPEWRSITQWTERLGFESLWLSDHHLSLVGMRGLASLEAFIALGFVASHTNRIRFGPLVSPLSFRHPALVARMAAAIDTLSQGRLILGLGTGWNEREHKAFGLPLPVLRNRAAVLMEGAEVIRRLLTEERVSFSGEYFHLEDAEVNPKGWQSPIPLLIGGGSALYTLAAVAAHADEWNLPGLSISRYREKVDALQKHCDRLGRDSQSIERSVVFTHAIGESETEAKRIAEEIASKVEPIYRPGQGAAGPVWLVGAPNRVVEQIQAWEYEGVSRIMLQYRTPPTSDQLELIASEVLPYT
jgi:alkanesulfonate monooxygenase SsuD/methylene tetrahydromethanopterin reductase-like flavin-dependent oxidoreductase (luciferase family)